MVDRHWSCFRSQILLDQSLQNQSLEASILAARCDKEDGKLLLRLSRFTELLERAPSHIQLWLYALETAFDAKHSDATGFGKAGFAALR